MSKVIRLEKDSNGFYIGIMETPCYPASFYAGPITYAGREYLTSDNATGNFHRTLAEAEAAFKGVRLHYGAA